MYFVIFLPYTKLQLILQQRTYSKITFKILSKRIKRGGEREQGNKKEIGPKEN
jgi:hypothetical protein